MGKVFHLCENADAPDTFKIEHLFQLNKSKIIDIQDFQASQESLNSQKVLFIQEKRIHILDIETRQVVESFKIHTLGNIIQVTQNAQRKQLLISTSQLNHYIYDMEFQNLVDLYLNSSENQPQQCGGSCLSSALNRYICVAANSSAQCQALVQLNQDSNKIELQANFKSKKFSQLSFGQLYVVSDKYVISFQKQSCLILLMISENKILAYEDLSNLSSCLSHFNQAQSHAYFIQDDGDGRLSLSEYRIVHLLDHFGILVKQNDKLKQAMKLFLKQKSLQNLFIHFKNVGNNKFDSGKDLKALESIIEPFFIRLFRKEVSEEIKQSPEYNAIVQLVQQSEKQSSLNEIKEVDMSNQFEGDGDDGLAEPLDTSYNSSFISEGEANALNEDSTYQTLSEFLFQKKEQQLIEKEERKRLRIVKRIYRENRKRKMQRTWKRHQQFLKFYFTQNLALNSIKDKKLLYEFLLDVRINFDYYKCWIQKILDWNDYYSLKNLVEKFKYEAFELSIRMLQYEFQKLRFYEFLSKNNYLVNQNEMRIKNYLAQQAFAVSRIGLKNSIVWIGCDDDDKYERSIILDEFDSYIIDFCEKSSNNCLF